MTSRGDYRGGFLEKDQSADKQPSQENSLRHRFSWTAAAPYLILALLSALYLYPFVRAFNDAPDSGIYLNGAELLSRGAVPSRDFVELQGPGSFLWLAIFFRLFGTTLQAAQAVLTGTGITLGLLTFWLSRRLGATGFFAALFVVMISVPLLPINNPHYDSNLFALGALVIFLPAWEQVLKAIAPSTWRLVLAAALCAITSWTLQQKGCYVAVALLLSLVCVMRARSLKPGMLFAGTYAVLVALPFGVFAALRALPDVLYANFVWPMSTYAQINAAPYGFPLWQNLDAVFSQQTNKPVAWLQDVGLSMPFLLVASLPLLLPIAARLSARPWFTKAMLPYWLTAYAIWIAELHRMDIGHLRNGVILMATLFFSFCEISRSKLLRRAALVIGLCIALSGTSHFLMSWQGEKRATRRGDSYVKTEAPVLDFLESHTYAGDEVFIYPYQPVYYFVEGLRNPTRYSNLMYGMNTDAQFREATADLERKQVRYVLFDQLLSGEQLTRIFPAYRQPDKAHLIMEPYLDAHYRVAKDLGRFRVLERIR